MTATVVNGVLLAVILGTWMWTWWWNRLVVQQQPEPDYQAAFEMLTLELLHWRSDIETGAEPRQMYWPLTARREQIARKVVNAAFDDVVYR